MEMIDHYGFGLHIRGNAPLPFWPRTCGTAGSSEYKTLSLFVSRQTVPPRERGQTKKVRISKRNGSVHISWYRQMGFEIPESGETVRAWMRNDLDPRHLTMGFSGHVVARLWSAMGGIPFHGGAVKDEAGAHIIIGGSGSGKSTTTAQWVEAGATLIGDEQVIVHDHDTVPYLTGGVPFVRLWPDAVKLLKIPKEETTAAYPETEKRIVSRPDKWKFQDNIGAPLKTVFFLNRKEEHKYKAPLYKTLTLPEATAVLHANIYGSELLSIEETAAALEKCKRLARAVPVIRIEYDKDYHSPMRHAGVRRTHPLRRFAPGNP